MAENEQNPAETPLKDRVVTKPFRFTEERVIKAIEASNGNKSAAARMLNCNRATIDEYVKRSKRIERAYNAIVDGVIDETEDRMAALMRQDDDKHVAYRASEFILATKGKERGWYKKQQAGPANTNIINVLNQVFPKIDQDNEIDEASLEEIIQEETEQPGDN